MKLKEVKKLLESIPEDKHKATVCALIGHSRISTKCFGYRNCARCGEQVGDNLGSVDYGAEKAVVVGHKCETCIKNYAECDWKDKFLAPNPFEEEVEQ